MSLLVEDKSLPKKLPSGSGLKLDPKELAGKNSKRPSSPSEDKCPICLVVPIENRAIANKCFHSFCKVCLMEWAKVSVRCLC